MRSCQAAAGALLMALVALPPLALPASAQLQTITTDHFRIHFPTGASGTARRVAETAEEVFAPMASAYDYYDDYSTIHILVLDNSDLLGNASADPYANMIMIWATNLDFELRGSHDWVRNTLTHELAHIMTLNKARKKWPFRWAMLQVSRFDTNPDIAFNFPLYHLSVPGWWSEGVAQYATHQFGYDSWDSHRDMLLRMATLEDDLLSYDEMGSLGSRSGGFYGEWVYNQGYALLLYIQEQYGREKVEELTHHSGAMSFDPAIRRVLGVSADELYDDWRRFLDDHYQQMAVEIRTDGLFEGRQLKEVNEGLLEHFPALSPDGSKVAFISSEDRDFAITYLTVYDFATGEASTLSQDYVDTRISWSPGGDQIVYVRPKGGFNDLYIYDFETKRERRISANLRAKDPAFSPDGERIVFVHNEDGTNNLGLVNRDGSDVVRLTNHNDATQYSGPQFSPDGQWLLFTVFRGDDKDIAIMRADSPPLPKKSQVMGAKRVGVAADLPDSVEVFPDSLAFPDVEYSGYRPLLSSRADERDAAWLADGSGFLFASDQSGIFNIYRYHLESGEVERLTNVIGGAFAPTASPEGKVVYAGYHSSDYSLYEFNLGDYERGARFQPLALRDYQSVFRGPKLTESYDIGRYGGRKVIDLLPLLNVGTTFLGDEFGLNQLSAGLQLRTSEQLGGSSMTAWGLFGKNFRADTDLNTDLGVFFERRLRPLAGNNRTFNPSFYVGYRRREVDSVTSRTGTTRDTLDSAALYPVPVDSMQMLIPNVTQYLFEEQRRKDKFKDIYQTISLGVDVPMSRRQRLTLQYQHRNYDEEWQLQQFRQRQEVLLLQEVSPGDTVNITRQLDANQTAYDTLLISPDDPLRFYSDLDFYSSHDLTALWVYQRIKPTAERRVNPTGRTVAALYRYMLPTLVDSLATQTSPDGVPRDPLGPAKRRLRVNEYLGLYEERIGLPFKNTVSFRLLGGYRNLEVKTFDGAGGQFEGVFYWPLRYSLGGLNQLSGYPYFTLRGSKFLYGRVGYTFPLVQRLNASFLNFHFVNIYAELFGEAGAMGNFTKVDFDPWSSDHILFKGLTKRDFLTDVGIELRMRLFTFYRLPMYSFFQIAHPLNRDRERAPRLRAWEQAQAALPPDQRSDEDRPEKIDQYRLYFGLGF